MKRQKVASPVYLTLKQMISITMIVMQELVRLNQDSPSMLESQVT